MNGMKPITDPRSTAPHYFIVAGISLKSIRKVLKPALPKKKEEASYLVVITATATSVKIAIAGAAIDLLAMTSGPFTAELPYGLFKFILTYPFQDGALVKCELTAGSSSVNGMATKSTRIRVQLGVGGPGAAEPASSAAAQVMVQPDEGGVTVARQASAEAAPMIANPLDAFVGSPLLTAYLHLRKYGFQPFAASKTFAHQQVEVDDLLNKVDRLLRPVGITRSDLERLLDRKIGLA